MIGVIVTLAYPTGFDEAKLQAIAGSAQQMFIGMPGLRSKAFTVDVDNRRALNFYVWESRAAAEAFFTPQIVEVVTGLYGVQPEVLFVDVVALVDNANRANDIPAAVPSFMEQETTKRPSEEYRTS